MIYDDFLDTAELEKYAAALNARARQVGSRGHITVDILRGRILESGGNCEWCGTAIVHQDFEIDHILALRNHGGNTPDNLATACPNCNRRKSDKHPARFALEIYAETGVQTSLIKRILDFYDMQPKHQQSLFGDES